MSRIRGSHRYRSLCPIEGDHRAIFISNPVTLRDLSSEVGRLISQIEYRPIVPQASIKRRGILPRFIRVGLHRKPSYRVRWYVLAGRDEAVETIPPRLVQKISGTASAIFKQPVLIIVRDVIHPC